MAYNNNEYAQGGQQGYGQYNPYGQSNPYDQREDNRAPAQQGYGSQPQASTQQNPYGQQRPDLEHQSSSRYDEERGQGGYEMSSMNGTRSNDPNRILNETRNIDREIDNIESSLLRLRALQDRFLDDPNTSENSPLAKEVGLTSQNTMATYRALVARVKNIKQNPESGHPRNAPQVGKVDRRLKTAINQYQQLDRDYRQKCRDQIARQYRIVRPDASEQEVREAVEDTSNQQVFSQALISSDRRGEAQAVANRVNTRHTAILKIEKDIMELAQMFNDLEAMVVQQEAAVTQIEQKGEEVQDNVVKANTELKGAVDKAAAARRKKWICFGIVVLVIIILAVVLGVVFGRK